MKVQRICENCGKTFETYQSEVKRDGGRFCGRQCGYASRRGVTRDKPRVQRVCEYCAKSFEALPSEVKRGSGRFCCRQCGYDGQKVNVETRFWNHVRIVEECGDECWDWLAYCYPNGYGSFNSDESGYAHRFAWKLASGSIPKGYDVHHACLNKRCQNAKHLELKTRKEHQALENPLVIANLAKTHCPKGHPYDETNTYWWRGGRKCRACAKVSQQELRARRQSK